MGGLFGWLFGGSPFGLKQGQHTLDDLAKSAIPEGMDATGRALDYNLALLSGDKAARDAAIAPEVNAASAQAATARRQLASQGTARGGGTNALTLAAEDIPTKTTVDALTALQPGAASSLGSLGSNLVGVGEHAATAEAGNALQQRQQNISATGAGLGAIGGVLAGIPAAKPPMPSLPSVGEAPSLPVGPIAAGQNEIPYDTTAGLGDIAPETQSLLDYLGAI